MPPDPAKPRGRGRPPDPERTAQTRDLIRRTALATFLERGFEGTRMAEIAARAGLAKGTLYVHFADKEVLFESVLQQLISEPLARLQAEPAPAAETIRARLERLMLPLLRDFEASGRASVVRLIIAEGSRFPALAAIHRRVVIDPMMQIVCDATATTTVSEPLRRFPQLIGAPVIMAAVWNGLWADGNPIDPATLFAAFLDLAFPPSPSP